MDAPLRIGDIEIHLVPPVGQPVEWVGQQELLEQILACWTLVTANDLPLCPRIIGKPGMGKTTLARAAGQQYGRPIYIYQCTMDTRPEDLLVTPVIAGDGCIRYQASALVSAMVTGGVVILDEANRMAEKSWASLAPLLDDRRYVESAVAGVRIPAHADFRACITMNDDASTYEVPEYIISRIQPLIALEYPEYQEELAILRYNVSFAPEDLLELCAGFLSESHKYRLDYSTRDGINIMRYAVRLNQRLGATLEDAFHRAVTQVLGEGAEDFEARAREGIIDDNMVSYESLFGSPDENDEDSDADPDANAGPNNPKGPRNR
ncbi:MAG: AAA family ATPase [Planctomycetota bacterium]